MWKSPRFGQRMDIWSTLSVSGPVASGPGLKLDGPGREYPITTGLGREYLDKCFFSISRAQLYAIYSYLQLVPKSFCTSYVYIIENPNNVHATLSFRTKRRCQKHNEHMAHLTANYVWVYIFNSVTVQAKYTCNRFKIVQWHSQGCTRSVIILTAGLEKCSSHSFHVCSASSWVD